MIGRNGNRFGAPREDPRNGSSAVRLTRMTITGRPTIADSTLFQFISSSAYAVLVATGAGQTHTLSGQAVSGWIDLTAPVVRIIFAVVPIPDGLNGAAALRGLGVYRHILAACLLIACVCFIRSCGYWHYWGERLASALSSTVRPAGSRRLIALLGYRHMLLGLAAAVFLLLLGENQVPALADYLFAASWTYVRAPLLSAIVYTFACHAVALRCSIIKAH